MIDLWGKIQAQQEANTKLQRKYDTIKGDLRVTTNRAIAAEKELVVIRQSEAELKKTLERVQNVLTQIADNETLWSKRLAIEILVVVNAALHRANNR